MTSTKSTTSTWKAAKNTDIFVQSWSPGGPAKAVICMVHGFGEHIGRYEHVAQFFNKNEFAVIGYDHFGHGKSGGKKGYIPSYEAVLDTVDMLINQAKADHPGLPVFLFGHSLGGNFVVNYVMKRKPDIKGVILSSPWLRLAFAPKSSDVFLAKMMKSVYPSFTQNTGMEVEAISRDPAEVKKYEDDPLVHSMMGPILFLGTVNAGAWAMDNASTFSLPLLLNHGTGDRITSHDASKEFASKIKGDITFKSWDGLFHETHNEPEKEAVMQGYVDWVGERL